MDRSLEIKNVTAALIKFQSEVRGVEKNAINPFFKSKHATLDGVLEATRESLVKNGLAICQIGRLREDGKLVLITMLLHCSGEFIESEFPVFTDKDTAQGMGSGISYARRYATLAILNLSQFDDDGEAAGSRKNVDTSKNTQSKPNPPATPAIAATLKVIPLPPGWLSKEDQQTALAGLFSHADETYWKKTDLRAHLLNKYQLDSTRRLTPQEVIEIRNHMRANPKKR